MNHVVKLGTAIAALLALPCAAQAQGNDRAGSSFGVSVVVPEYCEISASPLLVIPGDGLVTGTVLESCNTRMGFQVVASHRPLEASEQITFTYAGKSSYLQSHGWSEIANRPGARYGVRPISVHYTSLETPLAINLTITTF